MSLELRLRQVEELENKAYAAVGMRLVHAGACRRGQGEAYRSLLVRAEELERETAEQIKGMRSQSVPLPDFLEALGILFGKSIHD